MKEIDIEYDYRLDSKSGDPDTDSQKLYDLHRILWNKELPNGETLKLNVLSNNYGRLILKTNLTYDLSSDRMFPHFVGKYNGKFDNWLSNSDKVEFQRKVRTIGGHVVFPAHKNNGFTINQARGVNRKISDRFDLTLECIRRFYKNEENPLIEVLNRYSDFFKIFENFEGYIDFFLLQDFIENNESVIFSLPFDNFNRSALPESKEEYEKYMFNTLDLINKRNKRILYEIKKQVYDKQGYEWSGRLGE